MYFHLLKTKMHQNCIYFLFQGVRDLLKAVLDKIQTIPTTVSSSIVQQLLSAREVFSIVHLLDSIMR